MKLPLALMATALIACSPARADAADDLHTTIAAIDAAVFDAFNRCADPAQLDAHAAYFADDIEFDHDASGLTRGREAVLANTRAYVCGRSTRQLVPGTLTVHPVKDFGAIAQGTHRFCQTAHGRCDGMAEFSTVWQRTGSAWAITRVLSYGHRPAPAAN